jgi:adenylate cyclase
MGYEIERKFLVKNNGYRDVKPEFFCQGYLNLNPERVVRVRQTGEKAFITIKGKNDRAKRLEFEYEIPVSDAQELFLLCEKPLIEKNRYKVHFGGFEWEIDEFLGENEGLIVAEIELPAEDSSFEKPDWVGEEVTHDLKYYNSNLVKTPFSKWNLSPASPLYESDK